MGFGLDENDIRKLMFFADQMLNSGDWYCIRDAFDYIKNRVPNNAAYLAYEEQIGKWKDDMGRVDWGKGRLDRSDLDQEALKGFVYAYLKYVAEDDKQVAEKTLFAQSPRDKQQRLNRQLNSYLREILRDIVS